MPIRHPPWLGHLPTGSVRGPAPVCELANFRQVCIVRPQYAPQHQPETYAVAKVIASSIRKGNVLDIGGSLYTVLSAESFFPGKGTPTTQIEKIGRASCRERVSQSVWIAVVDVYI